MKPLHQVRVQPLYKNWRFRWMKKAPILFSVAAKADVEEEASGDDVPEVGPSGDGIPVGGPDGKQE